MTPRGGSAAPARAERLGAGGEAEVFAVPGRPDMAFKRYLRPSAGRAGKLAVMLDHPPTAAGDAGGVALAWPRELVHGPRGEVEGFLMRRVNLAVNVPVFQMYNPASRRQVAPGFDWRYLLRTARNAAALVDTLHRAGYVLGDLNESNLLVDRRAVVTLVDCDSLQVTDPATGEVHRCQVGKPEFLAPEFHGVDLASVDRTLQADNYALAVLVSLLLLEGLHPFTGVWRGRGEPPDVPTNMRRRRLPSRRVLMIGNPRAAPSWWRPLVPPPHAVAPEVLPAPIRALLRRALRGRAWSRPAADAWVEALTRAEEGLVRCARSPHHWVSARSERTATRRCPWCARVRAGLPDPFPGAEGRGLSDLPPTMRSRLRSGARSAGTRVARIAWPAAAAVVPAPARRALRLPLPVAITAVAAATLAPLALPVVLLVMGLAATAVTSTPRGAGRWWSPVRGARWAGRLGRELAEATKAIGLPLLVATGVALAATSAVMRGVALSPDAGWRSGAGIATMAIAGAVAWPAGGRRLLRRLEPLTRARPAVARSAWAVAVGAAVAAATFDPSWWPRH